ncbi:MAG: hypothetical protein EON89_07575 [Brevundimonas sp.]|nr:MAG: hypothetical protein EON89_07575 [Brevundimonas sp.]
MTTRLLFTVSAAALILSACAPTRDTAGGASETASASRDRQCLTVSQVRNFRQGGTGTVYLRSGRNEVFEVTGAGGCFDLDFANQLALVPDGIGRAGGQVCAGDSAQIVLGGGTSARDVCRVRVTKRLTAEEVTALPSAYRP